ncbi:cobaltochelatase subunit CobN [Methylocystis sp. MJC1]|uniref:cobaltochelatase subunit CobN n=1 Tax=Methylocystis sp. MJC1 TaxID=2654282 RepID=UPI0013ECC509|nr:cobaltochelatase subunit CobN [Methylocystis sp. MJC1]KAF2991217.1 Aerobic cobaltochelatase subunit CobN [Methylocystis sp. MJC1]MBU6526243.1 cobaltochelatase subunit CobN [Methylocystis sp. MJC1]UZX12697.1 cobaltochelatase subunit CobN [Methylocystis sp. MJC1]
MAIKQNRLWITFAAALAFGALAQPQALCAQTPANAPPAAATVSGTPPEGMGRPMGRSANGGSPADEKPKDVRPFVAKPIAGKPSVVIFAREPSSPAKGKLIEKLAHERGVDAEYVFVDLLDEDAIRKKLAGRDLAMFDWVMESTFPILLGKVEPLLGDFDGRVWGGPMWKRPDLTRGLTPEQCERIMAYMRNGGAQNEGYLADYIRTDIFGKPGKKGGAPAIMPEAGIYHPDAAKKTFVSLDDYLKWRAPKPGQKIVAVGFHRIELANDATLHIDDVIRRIEKKGAFALPFWDPNDGEAVWPLLSQGDKILPDILISFTGIYGSVDNQKKFAEKFQRPILQAMTYGTGYEDDWRKSDEGLPVFRMGVYYTLPEMAGRIDNTLVAAKRRGDEQLVAIPEQAEALVERALAQANLRHKPNKDKKLAALVWNTPEGEENFAASYLNIPASLVEIIKTLRSEGYDIPEIDEKTAIENIKKLIRPYYRTKDDAELRKLLDAGLAERVPVAEYKDFIAKLPAETQKQIAEGWEKPEDTYLTLKDGARADFVVPRWKLGNLLILPQPLRGARRSEEADILHDKKRPLHHAYRAVYYDLVHKEKVDAILHIGTHGTQEFSVGKERAPSVYNDTQTTIGNVPLIYPYAVHDPGEAIIARRRGRAVTISHDEPPFAPSGLYGELTELHELMNQHEAATPGLMKANLTQQIIEKAKKTNILKDIGMDDAAVAADEEKFLKGVDKFLHSMAGMPQPLGFRTFGKTVEPEKILLTIIQMLPPDYIKAFGKNPTLLTSQQYDKLEKDEVFVALRRAVIDKEDLSAFPEKARPFLEEARKHYDNFTHPMELQNLAKALAGGSIPTSTGNDPLRNPAAIPTGRNLYAFDPRKIPTKAAWEAGTKLARDLMEKYKADKGAYPDKVAFSLWQPETINHFGVVEAQILYMLGVEPVWNQRGDVTGVNVIPRNKLDRPRVDTVLQITGGYRDNLPELMQLLQGAVNKVAALKEDDNPVALNVEKTLQALLAKGVPEDRAKRLARVRLFGNESGVYGSKLPQATVASGAWDKEGALAEVYLDRLSYAYGLEPDLHSLKIDGLNLFAEALRGTKASVLSRSNNAIGIVSLDHFFEYLGGIGLAVRHLDGKTPALYFSDLSNAREFKNQTVAEAVSQELRSRMFHPRYIEGLMKERYSGATKMVDSLNNFWGWNVMDRASVRADQWQEFYEVYVKDKYNLGLKDYFQKNHPAALAQLSERMLEAVRKGYWDAPEEVVKTLVETHEEVAKAHDLHMSNEKAAEFIAAKVAGYGLAAALPASPQPSAQTEAAAPASSQQVTGMKLEKQAQNDNSPDTPQWRLYAAVLGAFGAGVAFELALAMVVRRRA